MQPELRIVGSLRNSLGLVFLFPVLCCFSQRISNFNLSTSGGFVRVDFGISKGLDCYGYKVWHSIDSTFFSVVEDYPGLCSSNQEDMSYSFHHSSPAANRLNFYKVELSNVENSPIQRIFVPADGATALRVYPNPAQLGDTKVQLRTSSTENGQLEGYLCDVSGHILQRLLLNCFSYTCELPINQLKAGIYFLWLSDGTFIYGAKLQIHP